MLPFSGLNASNVVRVPSLFRSWISCPPSRSPPSSLSIVGCSLVHSRLSVGRLLDVHDAATGSRCPLVPSRGTRVSDLSHVVANFDPPTLLGSAAAIRNDQAGPDGPQQHAGQQEYRALEGDTRRSHVEPPEEARQVIREPMNSDEFLNGQEGIHLN